MAFSKESFTSCAVSVSPSCNNTFGRRRNRNAFPCSRISHSSHKQGPSRPRSSMLNNGSKTFPRISVSSRMLMSMGSDAATGTGSPTVSFPPCSTTSSFSWTSGFTFSASSRYCFAVSYSPRKFATVAPRERRFANISLSVTPVACAKSSARSTHFLVSSTLRLSQAISAAATAASRTRSGFLCCSKISIATCNSCSAASIFPDILCASAISDRISPSNRVAVSDSPCANSSTTLVARRASSELKASSDFRICFIPYSITFSGTSPSA